MERAEEYYGRAILADPGDGEALSMYGKLIWETKRDEERAQCYFDQAVNASPDDWYVMLYVEFGFFLFFRILKGLGLGCDFCSMVLGSYAHFMWEAEDDEDEEEELMVGASPALV